MPSLNVRLTGTFTTRSPLSHIGETISTTAYLVQDPILQPDGGIAEVFCYSGNAWRGQLRDLAATYLLERLGVRVPLDPFHLLFSGGRIGGDQTIDIAQARAYRQAIPPLAILGGGVGNQILPGKVRVSNAYPVCREAIPVLPGRYRDDALLTTYATLTFEKEFSRKDDSKDERLRPYLAGADGAPTVRQALLMGDAPTEPAAPKRDGPADQMRMRVELLVPGVHLYTEIDCLDVTDVELGALVSALHLFARSPYIGGQANKGHGRVTLHYDLLDLDTGEIDEFVTVTDGPARLAPPAAEAKRAYDEFLASYDALLAREGPRMSALLGGVPA